MLHKNNISGSMDWRDLKHWKSLTRLDLGCNTIDVKSLCVGLKELVFLEELDLDYCHIKSSDMLLLIQTLVTLKILRYVNLCGNDYNDECKEELKARCFYDLTFFKYCRESATIEYVT